MLSTTAIVSCRYGYTPLAESELHGPGGSAGIGFDGGGVPFSTGSSGAAAGGATSSGGDFPTSGAGGIEEAAGNAGTAASGGAGLAGAGGSAAFAGSGGASGNAGASAGSGGAGFAGAAIGGGPSGGAGASAGSGGAAAGAGGAAGSGGSGACGNLVAPLLPATFDGFSVDTVSLNGAGSAIALAPGTAFTIDLGYTAADSACPNCQDQLEIGFDVGGLVSFCAFSTVVGPTPSSSSGSFQMTAPSTPGLYKVRFGKGQQFVCTGVADDCGQRKNGPSCGAYWSPPAGNGDIAVVCVQ